MVKLNKHFGGGICQVSTTIYNAALEIDGLIIVEHHDHGQKVPYIEEGKDATVSYNAYDLKFKNNLQESIKIYVSTDENYVTSRIVKLTN